MKCYQILDRFSEDIDISYAASDGIPGESLPAFIPLFWN